MSVISTEVLALMADTHRQNQALLDDLDRQRAEFIQNRLDADLEPDGTHRDWFRPVPFIRYDLQTGDILGSGRMSLAAIRHEDALWEGDGYLITDRVHDPDAEYFDLVHGVVRMRSECWAEQLVIDGREFLTNLPVPCWIRITDPAGRETLVECPEPEAEFEFDAPGSYSVTVHSIPCLDRTYTFEVSA